MRSFRHLRYWISERAHRADDAELSEENQQFAQWLTEALRAEAESIPDDQIPQFRIPVQTSRPRKTLRTVLRPLSRPSHPHLEVSHEDP